MQHSSGMPRLHTHHYIGAALFLLTCASCKSSTAPAQVNDATQRPDERDAAGPEPQGDLSPEALPQDVNACPAAYRTNAPQPGRNGNFVVAGQAREFVLLLPPASFTGPRPLFVGFNGTTENGTSFSNRAQLADFAARGFVVVAPSSVGNGAYWPVWDAMRAPGTEAADNRDLQLFDTLVACIAAHHPVDRKRIYVGGHSAGGIFANKVLRARSALLAGGIVASGVFSLTGPGNSDPISPLLAIVTWGGTNDVYNGRTQSGVEVRNFSFVEQASLASRYYAAQPGTTHVACAGADIGHAWLPINTWFIDTLLARPKGQRANAPLPALPTGANCTTSPFALPPAPQLDCPAGSPAACETVCQFMGDCLVENQTVGPVMSSELATIGFTRTSCNGCVQNCAMQGNTSANQQVLACMAQAAASATCGPGIEGGLPFIGAFNRCCDQQTNSTYCSGLCQQFSANAVASQFFTVCKQF